jgi:hypothetical protein
MVVQLKLVVDADKIKKAAERAADLRPVWSAIQKRFLQIEAQLFDSQGASGKNGRWIAYSAEPRYRRIKQKILRRPVDNLVLRWIPKGRLERSLTDASDPNHLFIAEPTRLTIGTRVKYAERLAQGGKTPFGETAPPRRAIDLTDKQIQGFNRQVLLYVELGKL